MLKNGLIPLSLLLSLTACAAPTTVTRVERVFPPRSLTAPTPLPAELLLGATNEDLVLWALDLREAVKACNADKAAIRALEDK